MRAAGTGAGSRCCTPRPSSRPRRPPLEASRSRIRSRRPRRRPRPRRGERRRHTQGTQLERLFAAHDAVTARWLDYELDVAKLIAFPAMSDGRQPLTAAFLRAKRVADGLRPASAKARLTRDQLTEYRNAVADFEVAFDVAERDARRLKDSSFTVVERKRLDTAKQLLTIAIDQAATPAERQVAYRRVREELDGLISLSDEAIEVLEGKVSLELTTGTVPRRRSHGSRTRHRRAAASGRDADRPTGCRSDARPHPAPRPRQPAPWPVPARSSDTAPGASSAPSPIPEPPYLPVAALAECTTSRRTHALRAGPGRAFGGKPCTRVEIRVAALTRGCLVVT